MCSVLPVHHGDTEGEGRSVAEIDKLLSSARFDNAQHVKELAAEEQRTAAAQKQILDKQGEIKCLEDSTSRCDSLAKELHQRLRRARDNCESSKRTSILLEEHVSAVNRKLQEAKELREARRREKREKLQHYQLLWERFQQSYGERSLAKQWLTAKDAIDGDIARAEQIEGEIQNLEQEFSRLSAAVSKKKEQENMEAEARQLDIHTFVIDIAKARLSAQEQSQASRQVHAVVASAHSKRLILEETQKRKVEELEILRNECSGNLVDSPLRHGRVSQNRVSPPSVPSNISEGLSGASRVQAISLPSPGADTRISASIAMRPPCLPGPAAPVSTTSAGSEQGQAKGVPEITLPHTAITQGIPMEVAAAQKDTSSSCEVPPPDVLPSTPTTPKTPQRASTPRSDRNGMPSPGLGLQKPSSPLDSFQYSGRPMFNLSGIGGPSASPSVSPGRGMPFFQPWNTQKRTSDQNTSHQTPDVTQHPESVNESDPASGFLAIAASLADPTSSDSSGNCSQGFLGGTEEDSRNGAQGSRNVDTPFSMFGTSTSGVSSECSTDSGFSFSFGGSTEPATNSTPDSTGTFSFSFGGGGDADAADSSQSSFSFAGSTTESASQALPGFSFGSLPDNNNQSSNFTFSFGASSPQQNAPQTSSFSLF